MNFIKTFLAALLAFVVGNIVILMFSLIMLVVFASVIGSGSSASVVPKMKGSSVLVINLKDGITDAPITSPFVTDGLGSVHINNSMTILQAVSAVESAATDSRIKGIYINVGYMGSISLANMEELRNALEVFRDSGKFIISYADNYSQSGYYLSSVADRIYLNPEGAIDWRGIASDVIFYKGLLDKLDIHAEIIRHGSFKAAVEPFMLDRMSPENREQMNMMLNSIWDVILSDISESRGIDKQVLSAYASDLTINSPEIAYDSGMIDGILYEDQVIDMLGRLAEGYETIGSAEITDDVASEEEWVDGNDIDDATEENQDGEYGIAAYETEDTVGYGKLVDAEHADSEVLAGDDVLTDSSDYSVNTTDFEVAGSISPQPAMISLSDYAKSIRISRTGQGSKHKIAIVYADGEIIAGDSRNGMIGGNTIASKLKSASDDENVKAVVLRVNSPGGSMTGSELIWREVELTRQKKPVIVSMGDMAASGGYYISCPADMILSDRVTLTGSIGVFSLMFDVGDALQKNLGITVDVVKTNPSADLGSGFRRISGFERQFLQKQVNEAYSTFVSHVADGRNMTVDDVDAIGSGRVWSGVDAERIGLVDGFGGIVDAVELAAQRGGAEADYTVWEVIKTPDNISTIVRLLLGTEQIKLNPLLGKSFRYYNTVMNMLDAKNGVQARMPYDIELM